MPPNGYSVRLVRDGEETVTMCGTPATQKQIYDKWCDLQRQDPNGKTWQISCHAYARPKTANT